PHGTQHRRAAGTAEAGVRFAHDIGFAYLTVRVDSQAHDGRTTLALLARCRWIVALEDGIELGWYRSLGQVGDWDNTWASCQRARRFALRRLSTLSAWARGSEWTIQRAAVADSRSPARATGIVGQGEPGQIGNRWFRRLAWLGFGFGLGVRNLLGRCVEFRCSGRQGGLWGSWSRRRGLGRL